MVESWVGKTAGGRSGSGVIPPASRKSRRTIAGVVWPWLLAAALLATVLHWLPQLIRMVPVDPAQQRQFQRWAEPVVSWSFPVAAAVAVLLVVVGVLALRGTRRNRQQDRVATAVAAVFRGSAAPTLARQVRLRRSADGKTRAVEAQLPSDFAVEDVAVRRQVETAIARVLGGHWAGDWNDRRLRGGRVTFRPASAPITVSDDQDDRSDRSRVTQVARRMFGAAAKLTATDVDQEGRLTQFTLSYPPHPNVANPLYRERAEKAITGILPGVWQVDWQPEADLLTAARRPALSAVMPYQRRPITAGNALELPVAAAAGQTEPAGWNLDGKTPHGMVTGETGGGKTYALLNLAVEALRRGIPVINVDPKMVELMALEGWPGVERLATSPADMAATIQYAHDLMMYRYELVRTRKLRRSDLWPVVVILDELLILQDVLNDYWAEQKAANGIKGGREHPALRLIVRMAALARTAHVHLIVGVQRPQATLFPEGARDNFRFRLSLGSLTQEGAQQMWGDPYTGTTVPAAIPGRGTVSTPAGPLEAQVFKLPELDLTIGDWQLDNDDATLRAELLAECEAALDRRPTDPVLSIGGQQPTVSTNKTLAEAGEPVQMAASTLNTGDHIVIDDIDNPGHTVNATVETATVETDNDEDRVVLDYRTDDDRAGQLDLEPDDQITLATS